jgi:hypothetical protein
MKDKKIEFITNSKVKRVGTIVDKITELDVKLEYVYDQSSRNNAQHVYAFGSVTKYLVNVETNDFETNFCIIKPSDIRSILN